MGGGGSRAVSFQAAARRLTMQSTSGRSGGCRAREARGLPSAEAGSRTRAKQGDLGEAAQSTAQARFLHGAVSSDLFALPHQRAGHPTPCLSPGACAPSMETAPIPAQRHRVSATLCCNGMIQTRVDPRSRNEDPRRRATAREM